MKASINGRARQTLKPAISTHRNLQLNYMIMYPCMVKLLRVLQYFYYYNVKIDHHEVKDDQDGAQVGGGVMSVVIQGHKHPVNVTLYRLLRGVSFR